MTGKTIGHSVATLLTLVACVAGAALSWNQNTLRAESSTPSAEGYLLRYKLQPGQELSWRVIHRASVRTVVTQTEQTAETVTQSLKTWKVLERRPDGGMTFELRVEEVEMTHRISGRPEVRYSAKAGQEPPVGFEDVAKTVGRPLARITLDPRGQLVERQQLVPEAFQSHGYLTVPFPENPIAVGESWTVPDEITVPLRNGTVRKIKVQQRFTLRDVKGDIATIEVKTQVLSPVDDPEVEVQLVQRLSEGIIKFDIAAGHVVAQEIEVDRQVVGFQGPASSFHYRTRFSEDFVPARLAQHADSPTQASR